MPEENHIEKKKKKKPPVEYRFNNKNNVGICCKHKTKSKTNYIIGYFLHEQYRTNVQQWLYRNKINNHYCID